MKASHGMTVVRLETPSDIESEKLPDEFDVDAYQAVKNGTAVVYPDLKLIIRHRENDRMVVGDIRQTA